MSTTIDERVVEMRFENKDFEKNVSTSLGTIEKLKKSLDFSDSTKSVENFGKSLGQLSFDGIANTLSSINDKISAGGALALGVISKIGSALTEQILNTLTKISSALNLDTLNAVNNMIAGWGKYAEKTTGVATIMAATGESIEVVSQQLEKLNYFTDETSYDFADMVNNIGKFTSNGVKLEEASVAMEGISTWAALSGQNAGVASRAMYNLAQAIGMGALKLQDWKSIELANMGTKEFKETALKTAAALGKITDQGNGVYTFMDKSAKTAKEVTISFENFRETLAKGWLDSDVLMATLQEYGKAAEVINDLHDATGLYAADIMDLVDAAKDHKLSIEDIKEALGEENKELANNEEALQSALEMIEKLASAEYDFSLKAYKAAQEAKTFGDAMSAVADAVGTGWMNTFELLFGNYEVAKGLWTDLANNLIEIFGAGNDARNSVLKLANNSGWDNLVKAVEKSGRSAEEFELTWRRVLTPQLYDHYVKTFGSIEAAVQAGAFSEDIIKAVVLATQHFSDSEKATWRFKEAIKAAGIEVEGLDELLADVRRQSFQKTFVEGLKNVGAIAVEVTNQIRSTFRELFPPVTVTQLSNFAARFKDITAEMLANIRGSDALKNALAALLAPFKALEKLAVPVLKLIKQVALDLASAIVALLQPFGEFVRKLATGSKQLSPFEKFLKVLTQISYKSFTLFVEVVGKLWEYVKDNVIEKFTSSTSKLKKVLDEFGADHLIELRKVWAKLKDMNADDVIALMSEELDKLKKKLKEFFGIADGEKFSLKNFFKDIGLEKISELLDDLSTKLETFKQNVRKLSKSEGISTLSAAFKMLGAEITKVFTKIKNYDFAGTLRKYGFDGIATKIENLGKWFDTLKEKIEKLSKSEGLSKVAATFRTLIDELKTKFGDLGINTDSVSSGFENLVTVFNWVKEEIGKRLEEVKTAITNFFSAHGIDVLNLLKSGGVVLVVTKLIELLSQLAEIKKLQLGTLPQAVSPVVETVNLLKKIGTGAVIVSFVTAVKELAIALSELGKLSLGEIGKSLGTLMAAMIMILVVFKLMKKIATVSKDDKNVVKMISSMAGLVLACVALQKFAKVLETYSEFDFGNMSNAVKILGILYLAIQSFKTLANAAGKSNFKFSNGMALIATAISLRQFGGVIQSYSKLQIEKGSLLKILGTLAAAIVSFRSICAVAGESKFKFSNGAALIATAIALRQFGGVIQSYSNLKLQEGSLGQIIGVLAGAIISFAAIATIVEGMKLSHSIAAMILMTSFVAYLFLFSQTLQAIANLKLGDNVGLAIGIIFGAVLTLGVLILAVQNLKLTSAIGAVLMMVGFVGVLIVLGGLLAVLSAMSWNQVAKSLVAMIPIVASLFALGFIMKSATSMKLAAMALVLVGAAVALYELAKTLQVLADIKWDDIKGGLAALAIILGMFLIISALTMTVIFAIGEVATLIILHQYAQELMLFVEELEKLSKMNKEAVAAGVNGIIELMGLLRDLANDLMENSGLYKAATDAAALVKTFGQSLGPICDDIAVLGGANPDNATGSITAVQGLIDIVLDLADKLVQNEGLIEEAKAAADLTQTFGTKLKELCEDVAILGTADADNANGSLPVVQGLIDTMLGLAETLQNNQSLIEAAITASETASSFGTSLKQLCEDTVILGNNADPETSIVSISTVQSLIDTMLALAETLNNSQELIEAGKQAGLVAAEFGAGLLDICTAVVTLGDNTDPETSLASVKTVDALIQLMLALAQQLQDDQGVYEAGVDAAALVKSFGGSLKGVVEEVVKLGEVSSDDATANVTALSTLITMLLGIADSINKDEGYYESLVKAAGSIRRFGWALLPLVGEAFLGKFIDAKASGDGFKAVKDIISLLLDDLAPKFKGDDVLDDTCISAATSLAAFGGALLPLVLESFLSQFINAESSSDGFQAVKDIINLLVDDLAPKFRNATMFKDCEAAATACKLFAGAVLKLTAAELFSELVNADDALESFEVTKKIAGLMLVIAHSFNNNEGMFESAVNAAEACVAFSKAIGKLTKAENRVSKIDATSALEGLTAVQALIDMMVGLAKEFGTEGFEAQITSATNAIDTFSEKIKSISGVLGGMQSQESWWGGYSVIDVKPVIGMFTSMSDAITAIAGASTNVEAAGQVLDMISKFVEVFASADTTATNMASLSSGIDSMSKSFISMNGIDLTSITEFINKFGDDSSIATNFAAVNKELENLCMYLTDLSELRLSDESIIDYTNALKDLSALTDEIQVVFDELNITMQQLGASMVENLGLGISNTDSAIVAARSMAALVYDGMNSKTKDFHIIGAAMCTGLTHGFARSRSNVMSAARAIAQTAYNGMNSMTNSFHIIGSAMCLGLVHGMWQSSSNVYSAATSIANSAYNGMNYQTNNFHYIGENMCYGIIRGINSGKSRVTEAARQVARDAYNAAKAELDINSPSKVFMQLGRGIDEGLALGISNDSNRVTFATQQLAQNAINMASQVAAAIEDSTIDPVITPVLDLTSIRKQSGELSSIMSANRSLGLSNRISQDMYNIQNAETPRQIVALDPETLMAMSANTNSSQTVDVSVNFEGSLSQLASILQPAIVAETRRIGINLVKE